MAYHIDKQKMVISEYARVKDLMVLHNDHPQLVHANNLIVKCKKTLNGPNVTTLKLLLEVYFDYLNLQLSINDDEYDSIEKRVNSLNSYYEKFELLEIESIFDSRSKIRSTILEEFMYLLLLTTTKKQKNKLSGKESLLKCGAVEAYNNIYITGKNVDNFIKNPEIKINTKNQDYAIYRSIKITIDNEDGTKNEKSQAIANVPILAIENKTFLDKTMLEGAVATAEKIKMGNPYAAFIVVTETYGVTDDVDPVYSRIDQIFVLRKCKTEKENHLPQPIMSDVVKKIVDFVNSCFEREWSDVSSKIKNGLIM